MGSARKEKKNERITRHLSMTFIYNNIASRVNKKINRNKYLIMSILSYIVMTSDILKLNCSSGPRIPYDQRTNWQEKTHYKYGARNHLHNVDMFIEHSSGEIAALVEFKNHNEIIEMWKYNQFINLANKAGIPAYICVGSQDPYIYYYIIPLNDICKKIPSLDKPGYCSERSYVRFLHYIKNLKADPKMLESLSAELPSVENRFQPNMK